MYILGISALYHDSAAALIDENKIIAAAQEERFSRIKHDNSFPKNAIMYCLREAQIDIWDVDVVAYYDNPLISLNRYLANCVAVDDASYLVKTRLMSYVSQRLAIDKIFRDEFGVIGKNDCLYVGEHHLSHAASAYYPSPFTSAAILTIDGVGEWATTTIGRGQGTKIEIFKEIDYPHSLGLLYSAFTAFCGFKVNFGDYKFMGLAPYGDPIYYDLICEKIIDVKEDGSFRMNLEYFDYYRGQYMTNEKFANLFGGSARIAESQITRREMNIAASVQKITEEIVIKLAKHALNITGEKNLVMAGGVALNCVANGKVARCVTPNIWIQPAAGDAGGALGCALYYYYHKVSSDTDSVVHTQDNTYLGPEFTDHEIEKTLIENKANYKQVIEDDLLCEEVATYIAKNKVVGWFQGRMEFGPRALGNRSIIGNPMSEDMQTQLNLKIKYRESFRPFAPSVLEEDAKAYFDINCDSPYMLLCATVKSDRRLPFDKSVFLDKEKDNMIEIVNAKRSDIPAVTHIDYSARVQTVSNESNKIYYNLINHFKKITGCSVVINTSFNVRGEPIVCTPEEAYICFMRTEMDVLVMGHYILFKEDQNSFTDGNWRDEYGLD